MKKRYLLVIPLCLIAYLFFYPTPIDPGVWVAPIAPEMTGVYATNSQLKATKTFAHPCPQCEDVAVDSLGRIYGGAEDGRILRFDHPDAEPVVFGKVEGRPLGLFVSQQQSLIVADAYNGLFSFSPEGEKTLLTDGFDGQKFGMTNDFEVGSDSIIYFTDASWKFPVGNYKLDLLEHQPNGTFYTYNLRTGKTERLLEELFFANGVALGKDQEFALICETGKFRVKKMWLKGPNQGKVEIVIDNLPGFPDGISSGTNGVFWIAIVSPRNPLLDGLMDQPFWRKVIVRLPAALQPAPEKHATVIGIDGNGKVIHNLQDPDGSYSQIANVREAKGKLYFGTLGGETLGLIDRPE